jgi:hypothetical protein
MVTENTQYTGSSSEEGGRYVVCRDVAVLLLAYLKSIQSKVRS